MTAVPPQPGAAELVRFHIEHDEYDHGNHGSVAHSVAAPGSVAAGASSPYSPHPHSTAAAAHAAAAATGKNVIPPPVQGTYPRHALVRFGSAPVLAAITFMLIFTQLAWFVNTIILVSVRDETNPAAARDSTGYLQILIGPLRSMSSDFYYSYGHEAVESVLFLAVCWAAVIHRTRQLRAAALFATTWMVFSWLIYTRQIFQGLDDGFEFCESNYHRRWCRLAKANGAFSVLMEITKFVAWLWAVERFLTTKGREPNCELDREEMDAAAYYKGNPAATNRPPVPVTNQGGVDIVPGALMGAAGSSVPAGGVVTGPNAHTNRLTTSGKVVLALSVLSLLGFILSMIGNIETQRLGFQTDQPEWADKKSLVLTGPYVEGGTTYPGIPVISTVYQNAFYALPTNPQAGDLNFFYNEVFIALLLFFAIGLSVAVAYDRVRDAMLQPIVLTFLSTLGTFGYFVYAARRVNSMSQNQSSIHPAYGSQVLIAVGIGITTAGETMRLFALIWHRMSAPLWGPRKLPDTRSLFRFVYILFDILMVLVLIAFFLVILAIESEDESDLFRFTPDSNTTPTAAVTALVTARVQAGCIAAGATGAALQPCIAAQLATPAVQQRIAGTISLVYGGTAGIGYIHNNPRYTYLNGQQTSEDALVFPYQMFVISLLVAGWTMGQNYYVRVRNDRVGTFCAFLTTVIMCAGWWIMCWPIAYAFSFSEGQGHQIFCRRLPNNDYAFSENICNETTAAGRLGLIFWIVLMLNMGVTFLRWLCFPANKPPLEARLAAYEEQQRVAHGLPARDPNAANLVMLDEEKPRHRFLISLFTIMSVAGFVLWAAASTDEAKFGWFLPIPDQLYSSVGFNLYYFIASHFLTLSMIINIFVHSHLAMSPTYRHFHYFWRLAEFVGAVLNLILAIPVLIWMARFIDVGTSSNDEDAMFAGIVLMVAGDLLNLIYCQSLFRRYPLFTTPNEYATHFTRRGHAQWKAERAAEKAGHHHAAGNDHRV